ncbi:MAG: putative sulfate exporter family transporter [Crocinitomicaceae bacterium]|nr:putative sulfate exporter family transporter [Crocinitomicaceae bacterium]
MKNIKSIGVLSVILPSIGVYFVAEYIPLLNSVMLGLLIGIIIGNIFVMPEKLNPGFKYAGSKLLEVSIVILAFGISAASLGAMGIPFLVKTVVGVLLVLIAAIALNRIMKFQGSTGLLTGFGTAICGSSAIAAASPIISENEEDAGIAIAVVNLLGAIGTFLLPAALSYIEIDETQKGFLIGGTLHAVGNVAGAGYAMNDLIGDASISIKMLRVALLSPMVILYGYFISRQNGTSKSTSFKLPVYLWLFLGITVLSFFVTFPPELVYYLKIVGKIFLTAAMFAIGLRLSLKKLFRVGKSAFVYGAILFAVQLVIYTVLILV